MSARPLSQSASVLALLVPLGCGSSGSEGTGEGSSTGTEDGTGMTGTGDAESSSGRTPQPDLPNEPPPVEPPCDVEEAFPRGTCDAGLCWVAPYPTGDNLRAAFQAGDDVFLGGAHGIRHRRDGTWTRELTDRRITDLAGAGPDEVYAIADELLRWDGNAWDALDLGIPFDVLTDVAVSPMGDVYVVVQSDNDGPDSTVLVRSEEGWTPLEGWQEGITCPPQIVCALSAVIPLAPDDVWVVHDGSSGLFMPMELAHYDGVAWTWETGPGIGWVHDVQAVAPDDIWMAMGGLIHYDGDAWAVVPTDEDVVTAVFARGADDVWIGGDRLAHWDGTSWTPEPSLEAWRWGVRDFAGASDPAAPLWMASERGSYERADGAWDPRLGTLSRADGCGNGAPWIVGEVATGTTAAMPGTDAWTFDAPGREPHDIVVLGAEDVWTANRDGLQHFDGTAWSDVALPDGAPGWIAALPGGRIAVVGPESPDASPIYAGDETGFDLSGSVSGGVRHLAAGAEDDLWVVTADVSGPSPDYALEHVQDGSVERYTMPDLGRFTEYVDLIVRDDGLPWAIAGDRVVTFDGTDWSDLCRGRELGRAAMHEGAVWITSEQGMLRLGEGAPQIATLPDFLEGPAMPGTVGHSLYGIPWISDVGVLWVVLHGGGVLAGDLDDLTLEPFDCG